MKPLEVFRQLTIADHAHFTNGLELLNRTQGVGLFKADYLQKLCSDPRAYVVGASRNDQLIGIGVAQLIHEQTYYLRFDSNLEVELKDKQVGSFSTLAIKENLQGQGIGQKISSMRLAWLLEKKCEVILGVSWVSGLPHTSDRVFEKMGFKAVKRVENFFLESSLKDPFDCPGCALAPCVCAAVLYRLDVI